MKTTDAKREKPEFRSGKRFKMFREEAGLTQKDIATKVKVSPSLICDFEKGVKVPSYKTVVSMFEAASLSEFRKGMLFQILMSDLFERWVERGE